MLGLTEMLLNILESFRPGRSGLSSLHSKPLPCRFGKASGREKRHNYRQLDIKRGPRAPVDGKGEMRSHPCYTPLMPLFDFKCPQCELESEHFVPRGAELDCETCGSKLIKLLSPLQLGARSQKSSATNDGGAKDAIGNRAARARAMGKTSSCC